MKENYKTYESDSNIQPLRKVKMGIKNVGKMLRMTSEGMYSNPIQTAVQEYLSNAKDSHVAVKKSFDSIVVTAPTLASQMLVIQDFGLGMSCDVVENFFAQFAGSMKEDSDDFIGGKGLGCKVWFAVSQQFTVVSIHDGMEYEYLFKRDNSSVDYGSCLLLRENKTELPNGVTLYLPLDSEEQIEPIKKAIDKTVKYWTTQPTVINHTLPETKRIFCNENYSLISVGHTNVGITVGGVPYEMSNLSFEDDVEEMFYKMNVVLHLPVEGIVFPTSREAIMDNDNNKEIIMSFAKTVKKHIYKTIKNKIIPSLPIDEKIKFICSSRFYKENYTHNLVDNIDLNFVFYNYHGDQKFSSSHLVKNGKPIPLHYMVLKSGVNSTVSSCPDKVKRIYLFKSIVITDIEVNKREMTKALRSVLPHNTSLRQSNNEVVGSYVVPKNYFTQKELDGIKSMFTIHRVSELDYKIPKRKKGEKRTKRERIERTHFTSMFTTLNENAFAKIKKNTKYIVIDEYRRLDASEKNSFEKTVSNLSLETKKDYIVASSSLEKNLIKLEVDKTTIPEIMEEVKNTKFFKTMVEKKIFSMYVGYGYCTSSNYKKLKKLANIKNSPFSYFKEISSFKVLDGFRKFTRYGNRLMNEGKMLKEATEKEFKILDDFKNNKDNAFAVRYLKDCFFKGHGYNDNKNTNEKADEQFIEFFKEKYD